MLMHARSTTFAAVEGMTVEELDRDQPSRTDPLVAEAITDPIAAPRRGVGRDHRDELLRDWALLQSGQPPFKIEPLH